eukprot:1498367-Alexandrium_andersonii.AAC.1
MRTRARAASSAPFSALRASASRWPPPHATGRKRIDQIWSSPALSSRHEGGVEPPQRGDHSLVYALVNVLAQDPRKEWRLPRRAQLVQALSPWGPLSKDSESDGHA